LLEVSYIHIEIHWVRIDKLILLQKILQKISMKPTKIKQKMQICLLNCTEKWPSICT